MSAAVQRRATKLVPTLTNLSYTNRFRHLRLPTLEYRRKRADMIQVYKILHGFDSTSDIDLLQLSSTKTTRGNQLKLKKKKKKNHARTPSVLE